MKKFLFIPLLPSIFILLLIISSCSKTENILIEETHPSVVVSDAGPDRGILLPRDTVTLEGSGMAYRSTVTSYLWTKISGPAAGIIVNKYSPVTLLRDLVAGVYKFELLVINSDGKMAKDKVCVTVYDDDPCPGCGD